MARRPPKPPPLPVGHPARVAAKAARMKENEAARKMAFGRDRESALDRAWKLDSAFNLGERIVGKIAEWSVPVFTGEITVSVVGGPHADIRRVWYLTLAAAFGRMRNTFGGGNKIKNFVTHEMAGLWDVTRKVCQVEIAYALSAVDNVFLGTPERVDGGPAAGGAAAILRGFGGGALVPVLVGGARVVAGVNPTTAPGKYIKRGPEQLTVGGTWPDWMRRVPPPAGTDPFPTWVGAACVPPAPPPARVATVSAVPRNFRDIFREYPLGTAAATFDFYPYTVIAPPGVGPGRTGATIAASGEFVLPDSNRVITTAEKNNPRVQPPAPILDGRGRSNLLALVAQSLQSPCFAPLGVPCSVVPNGDPGVFVAARNADMGAMALGGVLTPRGVANGDVLPGISDEGPGPTSVAAPDFRR